MEFKLNNEESAKSLLCLSQSVADDIDKLIPYTSATTREEFAEKAIWLLKFYIEQDCRGVITERGDIINLTSIKSAKVIKLNI